ncbi:hypothetical protein [Baaleninema simplex]|uniref:hypothetical protein n=1 Tax=Baaleninema simplex TaxID=2862350 RepID=UPI0003480351|nr:hypothetical protein [Baaleninema simplex]
MSSKKVIHSATLVKVAILEPIDLANENAESLKFRIEIFQWSPNRFKCKLWREETYRLEPTFQAKESLGDKWDVKTYVLDEGLPWDDIEEASLESAFNAIIQKIEDFFSVTIERSDR